MAIVTLRKKGTPSRLTKYGHTFERDVPKTVTAAVAASIKADEKDRDRFIVEAVPGEKLVAQKEEAGGRPRDRQAAVEAVVAAIDQLDVDDEKAFNNDGTPSAVALTQVLGWQVKKEDVVDALKAAAGPGPKKASEPPKKKILVSMNKIKSKGAKPSIDTTAGAAEEVVQT